MYMANHAQQNRKGDFAARKDHALEFLFEIETKTQLYYSEAHYYLAVFLNYQGTSILRLCRFDDHSSKNSPSIDVKECFIIHVFHTYIGTAQKWNKSWRLRKETNIQYVTIPTPLH